MPLPAGRYRVRFQSDTVDSLSEFSVPHGVGPVVLHEIKLKRLAWVEMLGKPAAEIDGVDSEGKAVKLADFKARVVIVVFWLGRKDPQLSVSL